MKLLGRIVRVADVPPHERDEMYSLMLKYYANMTRPNFETDLNEKDWAIQMLDPENGQVRGFSTQMLLHRSLEGRQILGLFSGDTIVDKRYWARSPLSQLWGRLVLSLIEAYPHADLYWVLISKGYKTYRFLPVFFHEFYPRYDEETPTHSTRLIDLFLGPKYQEKFDIRSGVIRGGTSACPLRSGVAKITEKRYSDPHIRFFLEVNPGHSQGDELCCIASLTRENFTPAAYRVIGNVEESLVIPK